MTGTLTFALPEDKDAFELAIKAPTLARVVSDLDCDLRAWIKHGHEFKTTDDALQVVRDNLREAMLIINP